MADADVAQQAASKPAPAIPDYLATPNAVFSDEGVQWRYGKPPDYSKTRKVWEESELPVVCSRKGIAATQFAHPVPMHRSIAMYIPAAEDDGRADNDVQRRR